MVARRIQQLRIADPFDGDDHMGHLPETHEDVADILAPAQHFVEPGLLVVVEPLQVVGTGVSQLIALAVDDAQVHQSQPFGPLVDLSEETVEVLLVD